MGPWVIERGPSIISLAIFIHVCHYPTTWLQSPPAPALHWALACPASPVAAAFPLDSGTPLPRVNSGRRTIQSASRERRPNQNRSHCPLGTSTQRYVDPCRDGIPARNQNPQLYCTLQPPKFTLAVAGLSLCLHSSTAHQSLEHRPSELSSLPGKTSPRVDWRCSSPWR